MLTFLLDFSSTGVSVVLFSADWAEQCAQILNVMNELAKQDDFKVFKFLDVAAEDFSEISLKHQVEAVPTVIFFRNGSAIDRIDGVNIAQLAEKCRTLSGERPTPAGSTNKGSLEDRLKALINKADIMCFVKGDKTTPRCGFSKQLIAIMNETG
jgi:thioredoxin-like negative regulator of GroEL